MKVTVLVLLIAMLVAARARADSPHGRRVVVRAGMDPELLTRVRGQVSDLPFHIIFLQEPPSTEEPEALAARLAQKHDAAIVVWFEALPERGWNVHAADVEHGDLLVRRVVVTESTDSLADSAAAEAAALVVRSTLSSLSSGERLGGSALPTRGHTSEPDRDSSEESAATLRARPAEPSPPDATATLLSMEAGVSAGLDTTETYVWYGPELGIGVRLGDSMLGVVGHYAVPRELTDAFTRVRLGRYALGLQGATAVWKTQRVELGASASAGVVLYERSTHVVAENVTPTSDAQTLSPWLGLLASVRYLPRALPLAFLAGLGVDGVLRPPVLEYARGDQALERVRIWAVQPKAVLAVQLHSAAF